MARMLTGVRLAAGGSSSGGQGRCGEPERKTAFMVLGEAEPVASADEVVHEKRGDAGVFAGLAAGGLACTL